MPGKDETDKEEKSLITRNSRNVESYENLLKTICNLVLMLLLEIHEKIFIS